VAKPLKKLERVKGIEPSSSAWKAVALPLSYTRDEAASGFNHSGSGRTRPGSGCLGIVSAPTGGHICPAGRPSSRRAGLFDPGAQHRPRRRSIARWRVKEMPG
jgi:hypothetical protein